MVIQKKELFIILGLVVLELISVLLCYMFFDKVDIIYKILLIGVNLLWLLVLFIYIKYIS